MPATAFPSGGNSKGIQGYFVKYVELGEDFELGDGPEGGLSDRASHRLIASATLRPELASP